MKQSVFSIFLLIVFGIIFSPQVVDAQQKSVNVVVLDAGHGGNDPGALKYKLNKHEKDLALDIVFKVGKMLNDSIKSLKVVYTRTTDVYPTLPQRHAIANKANGDLFISIHVNATAGTTSKVPSGYTYVGKGSKRKKVTTYKTVVNRATKASGTETYVLGLHRNDQKEKAIGDYGDMVAEEPGLLDMQDPMTQVLVAQYSNTFLNRSVNFADKVERNFQIYGGRKSMGVKQKGLEVLAGSAMPGVLIEIGFINNEEDEIYMNSEKGQHEIAYSIFKAIRDYKNEMSKK